MVCRDKGRRELRWVGWLILRSFCGYGLRMGCRGRLVCHGTATGGTLCLENRDGSCRTLWLKNATTYLTGNASSPRFTAQIQVMPSQSGACFYGIALLKVGRILKNDTQRRENNKVCGELFLPAERKIVKLASKCSWNRRLKFQCRREVVSCQSRS